MADTANAKRLERFTILEMGRALDPSPEELATRVVDLAIDKEGFTVLEMGRALGPSPEELATRIVEPLINDGPVVDPVPGEVRTLVSELAAAVAALDARTRRAALAYIAAELPKRTAG